MAKWPTNKLKYVDVPMYKQRILFTDIREVFNECRENMGSDDELNINTFGGISTSWQNKYTGKIVRLIGIFEPLHKVLVHECSHAAMDICNDLGIKISYEQQEPFCYMLEYIYGEAAKKLGM